LANDKWAIFQAAAHAKRAVSFLHSQQPEADVKAAACRSSVVVTTGGGRVVHIRCSLIPCAMLAPSLPRSTFLKRRV
jgi:hypothetical protein